MTTLDLGLRNIALLCFKENWYRKGNEFHDLTPEELDDCGLDHMDGGYCFLDTPNGTTGMIRLYHEDSNPKWGFEVIEHQVHIWGT
jgi:hypothetical protein